jgi:hypothetical protein
VSPWQHSDLQQSQHNNGINQKRHELQANEKTYTNMIGHSYQNNTNTNAPTPPHTTTNNTPPPPTRQTTTPTKPAECGVGVFWEAR